MSPLSASLMALAVLVGNPKAPSAWPPREAPKLEAVFRVVYREKGHPYVDESYQVDVTGLRKAWTQAKGKISPLELVRSGRVCSAVSMRFLVDISAPKRRSLVLRNLREVWPKGGTPEDSPELMSYLDWQGRELNDGDRVDYCFIPGKALDIRFNEGPSRRFTTPVLMQALRTVEFTDDPTDPGAMVDLEQALLAWVR